uniref:Uncharacterized protein n=1 Tax=Molossus molossus TaxID=27622 RepID=A0A7J8HGT3_MOLMO|nr:hypothetical protein HJG59_010945 [Molossus molossus]
MRQQLGFQGTEPLPTCPKREILLPRSALKNTPSTTRWNRMNSPSPQGQPNTAQAQQAAEPPLWSPDHHTQHLLISHQGPSPPAGSQPRPESGGNGKDQQSRIVWSRMRLKTPECSSLMPTLYPNHEVM